MSIYFICRCPGINVIGTKKSSVTIRKYINENTDFSFLKNKKVDIETRDDYYFGGKLKNCTENAITILDHDNKIRSFFKKNISEIKVTSRSLTRFVSLTRYEREIYYSTYVELCDISRELDKDTATHIIFLGNVPSTEPKITKIEIV